MSLSDLGTTETKVFETTLEAPSQLMDSVELLSHFSSIIEKWLLEQYSVEAPNVLKTSLSQVKSSGLEQSRIFALDVEVVTQSNNSVGEMRIAAPFFQGIETTSVRFVLANGLLNFNVRTFMESSNPRAALHDMPRDSESLLAALYKDFAGNITLDSEKISLEPIEIDQSSIDKFFENKMSKNSTVPLIFCDFSADNQSMASAISHKFLGLAHVLSALRANPAEISSGSIFVYWRDDKSKVEKVELGFEVSILFRKLLQHRLSIRSFETYFLSMKVAILRELSINGLGSKREAEQLLELEKLQFEKNQALSASEVALNDKEEFIAAFAEEFEANKRMKQKLYKIISILQSSHSKVSNPSKDLLSFDLGIANIMDSLELVSLMTNGAIIFTQNCDRTWQQAKKLGYSNHLVMETELTKLAHLAWDCATRNYELGVSIYDYAKEHYNLEVVMSDSIKLPNRLFLFDGVYYSQEPHIRANAGNTKNELGRVHFAIDSVKNRMIVNVIGSKQYESGKS
jgi:hypothetical protein